VSGGVCERGRGGVRGGGGDVAGFAWLLKMW
jgi:hypothetical protein